MINPFYLIGAGSALFLSFMKPHIDHGEPALYIPNYWHSEKTNYIKVNIVPSRRIVYLKADEGMNGCPIFCNKDNFEKVIKLVKQYLPDAKYVENEPVFK